MKKFNMDNRGNTDCLHDSYERIVNAENTVNTLGYLIAIDAGIPGKLQVVKSLKAQLQDMKANINLPVECKEAIENYVFVRNKEYGVAELKAEEGMAAYEEMTNKVEKDCDVVKRYYLVERPGDYEPDQFEFSGPEDTEEDIREIFTTGGVTKITRTDKNWNKEQVLYDYYRTAANGGMRFVFTKGNKPNQGTNTTKKGNAKHHERNKRV